MIAGMSRYTPKRLPLSAGGGPARPKKPFTKPKPGATPTKKKVVKKFAKPGAFACPQCEKRFNTEEALATHAADAHGTPIDLAAMTPVADNMARCPVCGAAMRKRNLEKHLRFIHETV